MEKITCKKLAAILGGYLVGNPELLITGVNRIDMSGNDDITFLSDTNYEKFLDVANPGCVIVSKDFNREPAPGMAFIKVDNPHKSFTQLLRYIDSLEEVEYSSVHESALIHPQARVSATSYIGPGCIIGKGCVVGDKVRLVSNVVLYDNVTLGDNTLLHSNVVCYSDTMIGQDCIIHAGAVIGADGFGFEDMEDGSFKKIPQLGNVSIGVNVEIGANTTIDRAVAGSTIIEDGVKLDNLVHIAHNCVIGKNTAIAAQTGIAGTTKIGKRNRFGGQVGITGHIHTVDDIIIIAQSGVSKALTKPGVYFGAPAKDIRRAHRIEASLRMLPDLIKEFNDLKRKLSGDE